MKRGALLCGVRGNKSKLNVQIGKLRLQPASLLQLLLPPWSSRVFSCSKDRVDLCMAK